MRKSKPTKENAKSKAKISLKKSQTTAKAVQSKTSKSIRAEVKFISQQSRLNLDKREVMPS